ncbi:MAG: Ammonia channel [Puniceicoccaceae bacterium MED-G32]|nr:MAG: Ammonia channel [Puniceicoccaceae bacterium MED-G32]|tara:strand:- start:3386 stop:4768 length:1383 start_codon:yes stop_codon:yes gene_type:complete
MKIKNIFLTLLVSGLTFFCLSANLSAEVLLDPMTSGDDDYIALLEGQGESAYAFDFFTTSMLWTVIAAALVFLMHLGFATLECGLTQSKNTVNILFKNTFIISMGILTYAVIGFNTHYPCGEWSLIANWLSFGSPIDLGMGDVPGNDDFSYGGVGLAMTAYGDFIFQAMFAATGATIVSGAVAERVKLLPFMIFVTLLVGIAYPVIGSWHWGGGWLSEAGFYDFAGSSVVHAFGGFAALACVMILGPRAGKYVDGKIKPIPGHSMPLAAIGVFLLFLGWFGFNGGSVLSANPGPLGLVFTTTALAGVAGCLAAMFFSWIFLKKPDISMALNGILAGLVGITAGADSMGPWAAVIVGAIAGVIVVLSIIFFDSIKIDDPVGAISVHGVCGIWGTVAVGIFGGASLSTQIIGTLSVSVAAFIFAYVVFSIVKAIMGVRVTPEEEAEGLDLAEHGQSAYSITS